MRDASSASAGTLPEVTRLRDEGQSVGVGAKDAPSSLPLGAAGGEVPGEDSDGPATRTEHIRGNADGRVGEGRSARRESRRAERKAGKKREKKAKCRAHTEGKSDRDHKEKKRGKERKKKKGKTANVEKA